MDKKSILVFGVGELQKSIIGRAHKMGLFVVGIDPCADAFCKDDVDAFEIIGGQDFEGTIAVAKKYSVSAVVTAATDKPLVMMARVAKELNLPFYSVETATWSTDKYQMKQRFIAGGVPCAKGRLIKSAQETADFVFPVIVKPRDNSGSRGVKLCRTNEELQSCIDEALEYSHLDSVLVEEFIEGQEYSIESLHYDGKTEVIQFTEKKTTEFPYNVELGHKQPANLTDSQRNAVREVISRIANALNFENCPSHTELKINERGIFVIETSPRLGGDYITSTLVPLSTGINIEDQLLNIALGESVDTKTGRVEKASGVCFFSLPEGEVIAIDKKVNDVSYWEGIVDFNLKLKVGDKVNKITSSLNRYGQFIVKADNRDEINSLMEIYDRKIKEFVEVEGARTNRFYLCRLCENGKMKLKKVILVGGFHEVVELCEECGYIVEGIIDNHPIQWIRPIPILGTDQDAKKLFKNYSDCELVISPDSPLIRKKLVEYYRSIGFSFATIIHPSATISPTATVGEGTMIQRGVNVSSYSNIGSFCKLNTSCNIMHDNSIGDFATIAPNAVLLGYVNVGLGCYVGANSTILPKCILGKNVTIGAGAVVTKNVVNNQIVVGNPAKPLKK